jgi:hypothetical protein
MADILVRGFVIIGVGALILFSGHSEKKVVKSSVNDICNTIQPIKIQEILNFWERKKLLKDRRKNVVVVSEGLWSGQNHDAKVSIGIALFCSEFPNTNGSLLIRGDMTNQILGSVFDGNWSD